MLLFNAWPNLFPRADGPTWKHSFEHPGHQERHGCVRAGSGSQRPTEHHADVRQLHSAVSKRRTGQAQLWPQHTGVPHDAKEESATKTRFAAKDHDSRFDWRELNRQMVEDDLPNRLFFLQHCLLALLCQLKDADKHIREARTHSIICCSFVVCCWFYLFIFLCDLVTLDWIIPFGYGPVVCLNATFGGKHMKSAKRKDFKTHNVPVPVLSQCILMIVGFF